VNQQLVAYLSAKKENIDKKYLNSSRYVLNTSVFAQKVKI